MSFPRVTVVASVAAFLLALPATAGADVLLDDFEDVSDWSGLDPESTLVHGGLGAGRWDDHEAQASIRKDFSPALDVSGQRHVQLWLYSAVANGADIELVFDSENAADTAGWDYYSTRIRIDWTGWKLVRFALDDFRVSRNPLGWNHINYISLSADGWSHVPLADTMLVLDDLSCGVGVVSSVRVRPSWQGADFLFEYEIGLEERLGQARNLSLAIETGPGYPFNAVMQDPAVALASNASASAVGRITVPAAQISDATRLDLHDAQLVITEGGETRDAVALEAAVPLPARAHPRTLTDAQDFARIADWSLSEAWAASARDGIVGHADGWPASYQAEYFQSAWALPPEGGQWGLWYVCPTHGARLQFQGMTEHVCPVDGHVFSGWPYDQVVYGWMHGDLAEYARDLGLAWRMNGNPSHALAAADILLAYADSYSSYALHDIHGDESSSGGRVLSQTLDEANWLIPIAWAYDLIADSAALNDAHREHIEQDLLRPAVAVIQRNPAGESNWQSWHNAAIGAAGFAMEDPVLISKAIRGADGFRFQMGASVSADGFWYEGSWGYHFYALDALMQLAQMSGRAGVDLFAEPALRSMFESPLLFAMPDYGLPAFNDSGTANLISNDRFFEAAYQQYGDPRFTAVLGKRTRGRHALLWGEKTLPPAQDVALASQLFPDAGFAVLRAGEGDQMCYAALDYGPHGGWHGHYDKLGMVLFARGAVMGVDPGTQSYAAPTHTTWDKVTIAHNTVVVDGQTQAESTGSLHRFLGLPSISVASVDAGSAYGVEEPEAGVPDPSVSLLRTLIMTPEYVLDRYRVQAADGTAHDIDWIHHAPGTLTTPLATEPYAGLPSENGYQHLKNAMAAETAGDWEAVFDQKPSGGNYGSVWADKGEIAASFSYSQEQAAGGSWSGKMSYDFSAATGYVLYSTPTLEQVLEAPQSLSLSVYGDGSGHTLALRLYDSTDERFVTTIGPVDWTGWKQLQASDLGAWQHYLGNDDGVFDVPARTVAIQVSHEAGGPSQGALYVDDITLAFASAGQKVVADFEIPLRALRLRMLGGAGTTVVTGDGLGPDLQVPVPFAMARRHASDTTFVSLLEPYGASPAVTGFEPLATDSSSGDEAAALSVSSSEFEDQLLVVADGAGGTVRTFGTASCDGTLCLIRRASGSLARLALADGSKLDDQVPLVVSQSPLQAVQIDYEASGARLGIAAQVQIQTELRILGAEVTEVVVNQAPTAFTRDGDYVVLNLEPTTGPDGGTGGTGGEGGTTDGGVDGGSGPGADGTGASDGGDSGGCGCRVEGDGERSGGWIALAAAVGVVLLRRRRD